MNVGRARPMDWKQALYFSSHLVSRFMFVLFFAQNAAFIKRLFCRLLLDWAGYLSISSLKTNPAPPKYFLEFDFSRKREKSVANTWEHEKGCEIVRLTTKLWLSMSICIKYSGFLIFCVVTEPQNSSKSLRNSQKHEKYHQIRWKSYQIHVCTTYLKLISTIGAI